MLPANRRLTRTKEIERVWKSGRSFFTPFFQLKFKANNLPVSRFAVVAGTKADKLAVKRNLWKRRVREVLYPLLDSTIPGADVLVIAKKIGIGQPFAELEAALRSALTAAGLIVKK